jgi:HEAT repeat protein
MLALILASIVAQGPTTRVHEVRAAAPHAAYCDRCGVKVAKLDETLRRLKSRQHDVSRYLAVIALRHYNWRCHPEIVHSLVDALQHDPDDAVRAEAAVSLARLGANVPEAIDALRQASAGDRFTVRLRAKWSLKVLSKADARA